MKPVSTRRTFVRTFAFFAAAAGCGPIRWSATVLAEVQPTTLPDTGLLRVRLSDFPSLQKVPGSVRLGTSPIDSNHHPTGLFYPVIINRAAASQFWALDSACSHEGCTVPVLDPAVMFMECPCHGSRYSIAGEVLRGPAGFGLRQFVTHYDGTDTLTIELPDISFALQPLQVTRNPQRLQLQFIAFDQLQYQLHFRPMATASWSDPVPFSLTASGPADHTTILGHADYAQIYVDRPGAAGFYGVSLVTSEV